MSVFLKPKVLMGLGGIIAITLVALHVRGQVIDYGDARYASGKAFFEAAVKKKAQETKAKIDANVKAAAADANKTQTVYDAAVKAVTVTDAVTVAENAALRLTLQDLRKRISNAPLDNSTCAFAPIPADSLSVHQDIDRLLRSGRDPL